MKKSENLQDVLWSGIGFKEARSEEPKRGQGEGLAGAWGFLLMSLVVASAAFLLIFKAFSVYRITNCALILTKISTLILTAKRLLSRDYVYLRNASCRS